MVLLDVEGLIGLVLGGFLELADIVRLVVDGVLGDHDLLLGLDGMILARAGEAHHAPDAVVLVDEVVLGGELQARRGVDGIGAEGQPVEVLDLVGGVVDDDVLIVVVHLLGREVAVLLGVALPVVPDVEDLLDDEVVDTAAGVGLLLGHPVAGAAAEPCHEGEQQIEAVAG